MSKKAYTIVLQNTGHYKDIIVYIGVFRTTIIASYMEELGKRLRGSCSLNPIST